MRLGGRRREQFAMKADRSIGIGRIPVQQDALFADLGSQAGNGGWRFAGQNGGGIGGTRRTTIAVGQFDEIEEWMGSADGQRHRESLGECAIGDGRELELAGFRDLPVDAFAATDADIDPAFKKQFVGIAFGHGPGEGYLVSDARRGEIGHSVRQIERWGLRRTGGSASRETRA